MVTFLLCSKLFPYFAPIKAPVLFNGPVRNLDTDTNSLTLPDNSDIRAGENIFAFDNSSVPCCS
jgi:hypothetical protein